MRVSHWNDLLSTFTSSSEKFANICVYSSSGVQGSPTPPLSQPSARRPSADTSQTMENFIVRTPAEQVVGTRKRRRTFRASPRRLIDALEERQREIAEATAWPKHSSELRVEATEPDLHHEGDR